MSIRKNILAGLVVMILSPSIQAFAVNTLGSIDIKPLESADVFDMDVFNSKEFKGVIDLTEEDIKKLESNRYTVKFSKLKEETKVELPDKSEALKDVLGKVLKYTEPKKKQEAKQEAEIKKLEEELAQLEKEVKERTEEEQVYMNSVGDAIVNASNPGNRGLQPHVAVYKEFVGDMFGITSFSLYRPGDPGDHGKGKAIDFMVPVSSKKGDELAQYAISTMDHYGVSYVIWKQHIYGTWNRRWEPMEDRGSITQNHYDHVHVSFK